MMGASGRKTSPSMIIFSLLPLLVASSNLALKKPAQQVSDFSTIGLAGNAVDGYNDGLYNTGSCSHTNDIKDNWWKVDLKGYYTVTQVDIFSRIEVCCAYRLQQFEVRVSVKNPTTFPSTEGHRCAFYPDIVPLNGTSLTCDRPITGRFVSVFKAAYDHLEICELRVFGDRSLGVYEKLSENSIINGPVRRSLQSASLLSCGMECESDLDCVAFNVLDTSSRPLTCELIGLQDFTDPTQSTRTGWTAFQRLTS
ncbi:fucolectin-3-like isoform X2 [Pomacea canaliculata]|uniref:fucolectin-3-like isoform X2 n=1 Tax=Pomacea canaliculata TaxID=400727 RepID=UPI000D72A6F4|nr:fucolectin-3-like isoform X2 [Pomacea canaliculata]